MALNPGSLHSPAFGASCQSTVQSQLMGTTTISASPAAAAPSSNPNPLASSQSVQPSPTTTAADMPAVQAHAANNPLPVDPPPHPSFEDLPSDLQASILDGVQNGMDLSFDELRLKTALPPYAGKAPWSYKDFADAGSSPVTSASAN